MPEISKLGDCCCGCGACEASCPKEAVKLLSDECGFRLAVVDALRCVECGACDRACPALGEHPSDEAAQVWWATALDEDHLKKSSSGGVFGLLAHEVLEKGGSVYGAAFSEDFKSVRHVRVDSDADLDILMRSKYVQSSIGPEVYHVAVDDLNSGRFVLFSGTACQIAGFKGFLGKNKDIPTLLCVDVVCHGVPSPKLWEDWVTYRELLMGSKIDEVNFRSKATGWSSFSIAYKYAIEKDDKPLYELFPFKKDWYMSAFLSNASLRESCLACPSKRACGSDLTLGDFWGIRTAHPEVNSECGVSAIIANTQAGIEALMTVVGKLAIGESSFDAVAAGNLALYKSVAAHPKRVGFLRDVASGISIGQMMALWDFKQPLCKKLRARLGGFKRRIFRSLGEKP